METLYKKQGLTPITHPWGNDRGGQIKDVFHHEVIRHKDRTFRVTIIATDSRGTSQYACADLLTLNGDWACYVNSPMLGIDFEHDYRHKLIDRTLSEAERKNYLEGLACVIKDYIVKTF